MTNFKHSSELIEFVDDNLKFEENSKDDSNWVENTVVKGKIARYGVFKRLHCRHAKQGLVWERLTTLPSDRSLDLSKFEEFGDDLCLLKW